MSADIASVTIDKLRNEIARLKNRTNWVCQCGGTDCEGQRENAKLRAHAERVGQANDRLTVEIDALRKDKERLDYAEKHLRLSRDALDTAMGVSKP